MTKNELAGKVAESAGLGVGQAKSAVDAVFDAIAAQLASGGEVAVAGFGKFAVSHRAAACAAAAGIRATGVTRGRE